jgi:hypothetical protein
MTLDKRKAKQGKSHSERSDRDKPETAEKQTLFRKTMKSNENSTNTQQLQLSQLTTILLLGTVLLLFSSFEKNVFNTTTLSTLLDSL